MTKDRTFIVRKGRYAIKGKTFATDEVFTLTPTDLENVNIQPVLNDGVIEEITRKSPIAALVSQEEEKEKAEAAAKAAEQAAKDAAKKAADAKSKASKGKDASTDTNTPETKDTKENKETNDSAPKSGGGGIVVE